MSLASVVGLAVVARALAGQDWASVVRGIGIGAWPFLLGAACPACSACPGMVWMLLSFALDASAKRAGGEIYMEPAGLLGLVFGVYNMIGCKSDSPLCSLFVQSVFFTFLVVLPKHSFEKHTVPEVLFSSVQKTAFHLCLALLITAVSERKSTALARCGGGGILP